MKRVIKNIGFRYAIVLAAICSILPMVSLIINEWKDETSLQLWYLSLMALFCALGEVIIMESETRNRSKKETIIRFICHYIYINIVVILLGIRVGWFSLVNYIEIVILAIMIAVIYLINTLISYYKDKNLADKVNRILSSMEEEKE